MAQAPAPIGIAPRYQMPKMFPGTEVTWRVLCDLYPSAETPEIIQAVVDYCGARKLDPLRKPVHIVPMWNAKLRRRVQVVMQGINEIETTAHRTKLWAGMDPPKWGPDHKRTFRGEVENEDGSKGKVEREMQFPLWCSVTVYRLVGNERRAFTEQLFWEESYATASFKSEVPNARWTKAPRQMLHKCTKAAVLRAAFPEEGFGYAAEEMEDHEIDTGGVTIEGRADHGDPGLSERDRRIEQTAPPQHQGEATEADDPLMETNGDRWMKALLGLLKGCTTLDEVETIHQHPSVVATLAPEAKTPKLKREVITDAFQQAHDRIVAEMQDKAEGEHHPDIPPDDWQDPIAELLVEIEAMDLIAINGLQTNAQWRAKVRDAAAFPPDRDRLDEAIEARKATLQQGKAQTR